ncbi:hypothetical protein SC171_28970 [Pantoea cypripedii]|uniref:hypothetical protein n=1 Tax=Pantoea cypripedii TaxID=55209 RepID=UPI002FC5E978
MKNHRDILENWHQDKKQGEINKDRFRNNLERSIDAGSKIGKKSRRIAEKQSQ